MIFIPFISISNLYQHILLFFGKKAKKPKIATIKPLFTFLTILPLTNFFSKNACRKF
jgi:hypothetical protein